MEQLELNPKSANKLSDANSLADSVDDEDPPVLSSHALAALKEFLFEQNRSISAADSNVEAAAGGDSEVALVSEDWRLSQFWYSVETARTLAEEVIALCQSGDFRVACIAAHLKTVMTQGYDSSFLLRFHYASYHTVQAIPRECIGTRVAARERMLGRIPAVVFHQSILDKNSDVQSPSKKHLLTTEKKQIKSILKSVELPFFRFTRFALQIRAGSGSSHLLESGRVLPIKIHRDLKPETVIGTQVGPIFI